MRALPTLLIALLAPSLSAAQSVTVTGTCPGTLTFDIDGLTPGGEFYLASSFAPGGFLIPGSNPDKCAGTNTNLDGPPVQRLRFTADGSGRFSISPTFGSPVSCGRYISVVDLDTCAASDAVSVIPTDLDPPGDPLDFHFARHYEDDTGTVQSMLGTAVSTTAIPMGEAGFFEFTFGDAYTHAPTYGIAKTSFDNYWESHLFFSPDPDPDILFDVYTNQFNHNSACYVGGTGLSIVPVFTIDPGDTVRMDIDGAGVLTVQVNGEVVCTAPDPIVDDVVFFTASTHQDIEPDSFEAYGASLDWEPPDASVRLSTPADVIAYTDAAPDPVGGAVDGNWVEGSVCGTETPLDRGDVLEFIIIHPFFNSRPHFWLGPLAEPYELETADYFFYENFGVHSVYVGGVFEMATPAQTVALDDGTTTGFHRLEIDMDGHVLHYVNGLISFRSTDPIVDPLYFGFDTYRGDLSFMVYREFMP